MTKKHRLFIALFLMISVAASICTMQQSRPTEPTSTQVKPVSSESTAPVFSENYYEEWIAAGFLPCYMQNNTILIVDGKGDCVIQEGGPLNASDVEGRLDVNLRELDFATAHQKCILEPNTKIEYDLHGFLNNIYYEVPGAPGTYQLSKPPY